jgi:hypothetical protein
MNELAMIVSAASLYILLILLWQGRERLKIIDQFNGVIGISYTAILGLVGASAFMLQDKILMGFRFTPNVSFVFSTVIMLVLCTVLYLLFVKSRKLV